MLRRRTALFISLAVSVAACSNDGTERSDTPSTVDAPTATTTTAPPKPTTTTTIPLYSFDDSVPHPELINTGTDYKAILQSLLDYESWLASHHPDSALVSRVAAPGSNNESSLRRDLNLLSENKRRVYERYGDAPRIEIVSADDQTVSARLVEDITDQAVVDAEGFIHDENRFNEPTTYTVLMVKGGDGAWRLARIAKQDADVDK